MKNSIFSLALVFSLSAIVVPALAQRPDPGVLADRIVLPDGAHKTDIKAAVIEAAIGRGWTVRINGDDHVVLFLENERWVSNLTLRWSGQEITINSDTTRNGKQQIPESWVDFLKQDITKLLNQKTFLE